MSKLKHKISALMTVYNESDFIEYAMKSCVDEVDNLVIVEGAYQESINIGASPRSTDGTRDIIDKYSTKDNLHYIEANEKSDPQQRNVGLEKIKELGSDFLLIIDGDEVYKKNTFKLIDSICSKMEKLNYHAAYFESLTFVNDFNHYTKQHFPRLFKITKDCLFSNDNFMDWPDLNIKWRDANLLDARTQVKYHHYSFCKSDLSRFQLKKNWWETRFSDQGVSKKYDWDVGENGKIISTTHNFYTFTGKHPDIMKSHKMWSRSE